MWTTYLFTLFALLTSVVAATSETDAPVAHESRGVLIAICVVFVLVVVGAAATITFVKIRQRRRRLRGDAAPPSLPRNSVSSSITPSMKHVDSKPLPV
ncbi:hypothetical protein OE88DRAFT_1667268 [Heliocybe sulcata]|uniref:Transmembrane protein n=1 Tax=Heliocybe sulcata TaxID=5364 RepID=A0A5C3MSB1_9AGAM|nr:hypothetical protein OE88DRAFT_1667268 [Heliocybe sulcata]